MEVDRMMEKRLQKLLDDKGTPEWCALLELMIGQLGNLLVRKWDYEIAEKYRPNMKNFTMEDFIASRHIEDIPEDWLAYAYACMRSLGL